MVLINGTLEACCTKLLLRKYTDMCEDYVMFNNIIYYVNEQVKEWTI